MERKTAHRCGGVGVKEEHPMNCLHSVRAIPYRRGRPLARRERGELRRERGELRRERGELMEGEG
jgi:hypothetical protein